MLNKLQKLVLDMHCMQIFKDLALQRQFIISIPEECGASIGPESGFCTNRRWVLRTNLDIKSPRLDFSFLTRKASTLNLFFTHIIIGSTSSTFCTRPRAAFLPDVIFLAKISKKSEIGGRVTRSRRYYGGAKN